MSSWPVPLPLQFLHLLLQPPVLIMQGWLGLLEDIFNFFYERPNLNKISFERFPIKRTVVMAPFFNSILKKQCSRSVR